MHRMHLLLTPLACVLAFALCCASAHASAARDTLEQHANVLMEMIKTPEYANPATRPQMHEKIAVQVRKIFDFAEFSSRTIGQRWAGFSEAQKMAFTAAFDELLLETYLGKIKGYNGEVVAYTGEVTNTRGDRCEVRTELTLNGGRKIPIAYRMLPKNGTWIVYDVLVEGISLVKNYRTQFQDILNRASPEELTARVRAKTAEVQAKYNAR